MYSKLILLWQSLVNISTNCPNFLANKMGMNNLISSPEKYKNKKSVRLFNRKWQLRI